MDAYGVQYGYSLGMGGVTAYLRLKMSCVFICQCPCFCKNANFY